MIRLFAPLSLRHFQRRPFQTMLMILGIALGVATWCISVVVERSLDRALEQTRDPLSGTADIYISNGDAGMPKRLAELLRDLHGVRSVKCRMIKRATLPELDQTQVVLLGIDQGEEGEWDLPDVVINRFAAKRWAWSRTFGKQDVLIGRELDDKLNSLRNGFRLLVDGHRVIMSTQGIIDAAGPSSVLAGNVIVMPIDDVFRIVGRSDSVSRMDISVERSISTQLVVDEIRNKVGGLLRVCRAEDQARPTGDVMQTVKDGLSLGGFGAIPLGIFLVACITSVSIAERQRDAGVLRTLGATRFQVRILFLIEALVIGSIASIVGIGIGQLLAFVAINPLQQALSQTIVPVELREAGMTAGQILSAMGVGIAATLLGAVLPIWRGTAGNPIDVIKGSQPSLQAPVRWKTQVGAALFLVAVGVITAVYRSNLATHVGSYLGLLLPAMAALIIAPMIARSIQSLCHRAIPFVTWQLAMDSILGSPGRARFVTTAVALSVALVLQLAGVIRSNEAGVKRWVDRSVAGDLFVTSGGPLTASGQSRPMPKSLGQELKLLLPGSEVVPMRFRFVEMPSGPRVDRILVLSMDSARYVTANEKREPVLPDLSCFRELTQKGTMVISENYALLQNMKVGDSKYIPGSQGLVQLRAVGIVPDYSCARGTIMVDDHVHGMDFSDESADVLDLYLSGGTSPDDARRQLLAQSVVTREDLTILTHRELRSHILGMVGNLYGLAYAQEAIVGLVAVVGIAASLVVSTLQRRRELGFLRAQGATRSQIVSVVLAEAIILAATGALIGLFIGVGLDWYTQNVILADETGFPLPFQLPVIESILAVAISVLAAMIAGWGPAHYAARQSIAVATAFE